MKEGGKKRCSMEHRDKNNSMHVIFGPQSLEIPAAHGLFVSYREQYGKKNSISMKAK